MTFTKASASIGQREQEVLSADNLIKSQDLPERHIIIEMLRNAAPKLGLNTPVISTLDAMLSCLAPKRTHHTVFASNATLTFRRNGISDRTLRRHVCALQEAGLIFRNDSPNKKRYTRHSTLEGKALRFGFDLTPLFERLRDIAHMAAQVLQEREQIAFLKAKIRSAANIALIDDPLNETAKTALTAVRRKLSASNCIVILEKLEIDTIPAEKNPDISQSNTGSPTHEPTQNSLKTTSMSANSGQNVRHYHKSNKELIDKERTVIKNQQQSNKSDHIQTLTIPKLISVCSEANSFTIEKVRTHQDVILHAQTLAPMLGIDSQTYYAAQNHLGPFDTAVTIWAIMQFQNTIRNIGAYFRAITIGSKSKTFDIMQLIDRLSAKQAYVS